MINSTINKNKLNRLVECTFYYNIKTFGFYVNNFTSVLNRKHMLLKSCTPGKLTPKCITLKTNSKDYSFVKNKL